MRERKERRRRCEGKGRKEEEEVVCEGRKEEVVI